MGTMLHEIHKVHIPYQILFLYYKAVSRNIMVSSEITLAVVILKQV
jgi:hypothetical protein